jgi:hypothetical protein
VNVRRLLSLIAIVAASLAGRDLAAQTTDVIRGKVTGPDSLPIQGVTVTATSISGNVSRQARTDKNGNFSISFPNGDGDYIVAFASLGFAGRKFEVKRTADQEFLVADARLARSAVTLDAMKVESQRQKPGRNDALATDISGTERGLGGGVLGIDQMGDLAAMAGTLPGFSYIPAGAEAPPASRCSASTRRRTSRPSTACPRAPTAFRATPPPASRCRPRRTTSREAASPAARSTSARAAATTSCAAT